MRSDVEARYHTVLAQLGVNQRWYQKSTSDFFAAVIGAVDDVTGDAIAAGEQQLRELLPARHELHLVRLSVAAIAAARGLALEPYLAAADEAAELLREAARSKRNRRIAGAVIAAAGTEGLQLRTTEVVTLYQSWKNRRFTTADDLVLAAASTVGGLDPTMAVTNEDLAAAALGPGAYSKQWELARILAVREPAESARRFLELAGAMRGRRRKPLTDRRAVLAVAALSNHAGAELPELVARRAETVRVSRWRPDQKTSLTLAALLTFGESTRREESLRVAFHGFVLREHYRESYSEATSG